MRLAARKHGARVLALSPWRLQWHDDAATRAALGEALAASRVVFTSPVAVRAAAALLPLQANTAQHWIAVGSGTAFALQRAGIALVQSPTRMDSEGLLALDSLANLTGATVGLVTAPEGRDVLSPALRQRGAQLLRANVYTRVPIALSTAALNKLRALDAPAGIALSSDGALQQMLAHLPSDLQERMRALPVVAASPRLMQAAHEAGFTKVEVAQGPRPQQILAAMAHGFR